MKTGKHSNVVVELNKTKKQLDEAYLEIDKLKCDFSDILLQIRNLNESNTYGNDSAIRRKISELCTDTRYKLLVDDESKKDTSCHDNKASISRK